MTEEIQAEDKGENEDIEDMNKKMSEMLTSVKETSLSQMSLLTSQAWHHLGLVPFPGIEAVMDLEQARLAIDLLEANLKVMSPHIDEEMGKEFRRVIADLQLNFVNKSEHSA